MTGTNGLVESGARPARAQRNAALWRALPIIAVVLSLAISAIAARNRSPWSDEGWFSSASYNLAKHGFMGTTVFEPASSPLTRIGQRTYWVMPLYLLAQAAWYKAFPATVFWTRALNVIWSVLALSAFFSFLSGLFPRRRIAEVGTCLLALSFVFIDNAGFARPDLMCCSLGLSGLAVYLRLREVSLSRALFWANLLVAASGMTHPNGIFHLAGLVALVLWFDRRRLSAGLLAAAAAPYVILGLGWVAYIFQDPPAFWDQMRANGTNGRWTATLNPAAILWGEIRDRYFVAFGLITRGAAIWKSVALLCYFAAVAAACSVRRLRQQEGTRVLLMLVAVYFAGMCIFNQKLSYYLIHIVPWYIALVAVCAVSVWEWQPRLRGALAAALLLLTAIESGGILVKARQRSYIASQREAVGFVQQHAAPGSHIAGTAALLYNLGFDPRLHDDPYLGLRGGPAPDVVVIEQLYRLAYDAWQNDPAQHMAAIRERLAHDYVRAYYKGEYEIYLRRNDAAAIAQ